MCSLFFRTFCNLCIFLPGWIWMPSCPGRLPGYLPGSYPPGSLFQIDDGFSCENFLKLVSKRSPAKRMPVPPPPLGVSCFPCGWQVGGVPAGLSQPVHPGGIGGLSSTYVEGILFCWPWPCHCSRIKRPTRIRVYKIKIYKITKFTTFT